MKKIEETSKKAEAKAAAETMHTLVDQAVNLINTSLLVGCCSFVVFSSSVLCDLLCVF